MSITITLTANEANALYDVLNHASRDIEERLPDCKADPEEMEVWGPMYDGAMRVMELIEAETTQQIIEGGRQVGIDIEEHIKDIIVDALSCAADNALDMYVGSVDSQAYAVGMITLEVLCGDGDERIDCGYFDRPELDDREITRGECRPHLTQAINEFLKIEGGA